MRAFPPLLRGNRQSVAVLGGRETPAQLTALADDIWAYSGLGCRSVSLLFLPEGYDLQLRMPEVNVKYRNSYRQQKALLTMADSRSATWELPWPSKSGPFPRR